MKKLLFLKVSSLLEWESSEEHKILERLPPPKRCNQIGTNALFYCSSLEEVTINTTNQYFGDKVFSACAKLYNINYEGTKLQRLEHLIPDSDFVIQCTDGSIVVDEKGKVQLNV